MREDPTKGTERRQSERAREKETIQGVVRRQRNNLKVRRGGGGSAFTPNDGEVLRRGTSLGDAF